MTACPGKIATRWHTGGPNGALSNGAENGGPMNDGSPEILSLFSEALERPSAEERAAYLTAGASSLSRNACSQTVPPLRLPGMTLYLRRRSAYPAGLTASQLIALERVWEMAGMMPMKGYERVFLVAAVSADPGLVETLSSVDLNDSESVANAVSDLLQWSKRVMD